MKKKICVCVSILFFVLLVVSSFFIISQCVEEKQQNDKFDSIAKVVEAYDSSDNLIQYVNDKQVLAEYTKLYLKNKDMVGWIKIDGTNINYPVMQSKGNSDFYLRRGFDKNYSYYGCPYVQSNCDVYTPSDNLIIYGHNMRNGSMFSNLIKYENKKFWNNHKTIIFNTMTDKQNFEIVCVLKTSAYSKDGFRYYDFVNAKTAKDFDSYISDCKKNALYSTGVSTTYGDKLITISTCEYSRDNGRLVVVAKRI